MLRVDVERTLYEATTTKSGNEAFLVIYYCENGLVLKEWLFPKSAPFREWWENRSTTPTPSSAKVAANLASVGKVRPTRSLEYTQEGRWPKVKSTTVGEYPLWVAEFLRDAIDIFGDVSVKKVIL